MTLGKSIVEFFIENGFFKKILVVDRWGNTPIDEAARGKHHHVDNYLRHKLRERGMETPKRRQKMQSIYRKDAYATRGRRSGAAKLPEGACVVERSLRVHRCVLQSLMIQYCNCICSCSLCGTIMCASHSCAHQIVRQHIVRELQNIFRSFIISYINYNHLSYGHAC